MSRLPLLLSVPLLAGVAAAQTAVFSTDFSSLPAQVQPGTGQLEGVQGFGGLGPPGGLFAGTFLRCPTGSAVTVTLTGLPPHNALSLDFLFAAIDSLDGTGVFPSGDFFAIRIDGNTFFRESFANALPSQVQSYVSPPGVELARHQDLGFSGPGGYYTDSAYWLGGDPRFQHIGHSADSVSITLQIEGPGIQPLGDESWAIDGLTIGVFTVSDPGSATAYGTSCGPSLSVFGLPTVGQPMHLFAQNLPGDTVVAGYAVGLSDAPPLPLPLDVFGAPGCWLLQDLAIATDWGMLLQGTAATATLTVPAPVGYPGLTFFLQGWGLSPGSNAMWFVFGNGVRVVLGN